MAGAQHDAVIIGAGLSGLAAARTLEAAGRSTLVLDKGRSVGGRLATRRITTPSGAIARLDHGAQFFTQRGPEMADLVEALLPSGDVRIWCRGFEDPDGHPRYFAPGGMNSLAKRLAAGLTDVRTGIEVRTVRSTSDGWTVAWDGGDATASAALLTAPVPQSLALIEAGGVEVDPGILPSLEQITYDAAIAVLLVLDGPSAVPEPGARQLGSGPFTFVCDNSIKGISDVPAITLHASDRWSRGHFDAGDDEILAEAVPAATKWLGGASVVAGEVKRWRYAAPRSHWPEPCCVAVDGTHPLVLAGDAFDGPRVEGAYRSGVAAGTALLRGVTV
jgi:renalase